MAALRRVFANGAALSARRRGSQWQVQAGLTRRAQFSARRCAWRAGSVSECVSGHPAALEPGSGRAGNHGWRLTGSGGSNPNRRVDRRDPGQARADCCSTRGVGGGCGDDLCCPAFLARDDRQFGNGRSRRRIRPGGGGADPGTLRPQGLGSTDGAQFGLGSRRQRRNRRRCRRRRLGVFTARGVFARAGFCRAGGPRGAVDPGRCDRSCPGARRGERA